MPVVSESKRVDNCVVVNRRHHGWDHHKSSEQPGNAFLLFREAVVHECGKTAAWKNEVGKRSKENRPREEDEERPDVEHLRDMQTSGVEFLVS